MLAGLTHAECALPDSGQSFLDRPQEMSIGLMHADLKLGFGVGVGLICEIAGPLTRSWYQGLGSVSPSRQLIELSHQQSPVPI